MARNREQDARPAHRNWTGSRALAHISCSMAYKLVSNDGLHTFELRDGATVVVGRAPTSDIPVIDPTISRRHAEVQAGDDGVQVRDLGSSNGTFVNGTRVETGTVRAGDTLTFGKVGFRLQPVVEVPTVPAP